MMRGARVWLLGLALVAAVGMISFAFRRPMSKDDLIRHQARALATLSSYELPFLHYGGDWATCSEEQLLRWGRERGIRHDKLELGNFKFENSNSEEQFWQDRIASRRGMRATADIAAGEVIITIPEETLITRKTAASIPQLKKLVESETHLEDLDTMVIFVLHEMRNPKSEFAAVICKFPRTYDNSLYWTKSDFHRILQSLDGREELRRMDGDVIRGMTISVRYHMVHMYNSMFPHLSDKYPEAFPGGAPSLEEFVWAASSVYSRNWMIEVNNVNVNVMGVIADMCNHRSDDHGYVEARKGQFAMVAGRNYHIGDEVFTNYGPKCNEELLVHYGFSDLINTIDCHASTRARESQRKKNATEQADGAASVSGSGSGRRKE